MKEKRCTKCGEVKSLKLFSKNKNNKDGLKYTCKICDKEKSKDYRRTVNGLVSRIYGNQKIKSKIRNHSMPNYTKKQLEEWVFSQPNFYKLFNNWVNSGHLKKLVPSCDRKDDYKPYSFDNLNPLTTWGEHKKKSYEDRKNGINNKLSKAVIGVHLETSKIVEFYSINEAGRVLKISKSGISEVCVGKKKKDNRGYLYLPKTAGGYKWYYKKDYEKLVKSKN